MSSFAAVDDDLEAMEKSCMQAFVGPEQLSVLLEMLKFRETPDNHAFEREFGENIEE